MEAVLQHDSGDICAYFTLFTLDPRPPARSLENRPARCCPHLVPEQSLLLLFHA